MIRLPPDSTRTDTRLPYTTLVRSDKDDPGSDAVLGEPGELAVAGPQVMRGYWNHPDAAAQTFVERDGRRWLRTGDIAAIDEEGYVRIVDRLKDRSEEHTSELQSLMRNSYAVFCLQKKKTKHT